MSNMPVGGRSSETSSHPIDLTKIIFIIYNNSGITITIIIIITIIMTKRPNLLIDSCSNATREECNTKGS
jgi:hypothetical protein